jgi:hypothetical protein
LTCGAAGSLPDWLSLDTTNGVVSGTPQTALNASVTVRCSTGVNVSGLKYVSSSTQINVASPTITLTYPEAAGVIGWPLSVSPSVTGLAGIPVYSLLSGSLPTGLALDPMTGVIAGVPTGVPGSFPVVVQVSCPYGNGRTSVVVDLQAAPDSTAAPMLKRKQPFDWEGLYSDIGREQRREPRQTG